MKAYVFNFRDMGGLPCADGKTILSGKLFRSAALTDERPRALASLHALHLNTVLDLRCPEEVENAPDFVPTGTCYMNIPVLPHALFDLVTVAKGNKKKVLALKGDRIEDMRQQKIDSYAYMPFSHAAFSTLLACMDRGETILFHCTEGKDRTGVMAALIEYILGRTEADIRKEYLRSNDYMAQKNRRTQFLLRLCRVDKRLQEVILFAERTDNLLLDTTLGAIYEKYPSVDAFLAKEYGVTDERKANWRHLYCR